MMAACPTPTTGGAFLSALLNHIDCQAQNIGAGGYLALSASSSAISLALTGLLTLFVALFGVRLLLGHSLDIRDAVIAVVKIGVVLLLASSWPAYRTLAYDVVLHGPAELAEAIGGSAGLPGASGGLAARLQNVDNMIVMLAERGTGGSVLAQNRDPNTPAPPTGLITDGFALGTARVAYLSGTIGGVAIVRLAAGILLALAPLFAGLLLFDGTRAFFFGWVRGLVAAALGALGLTIVLGVELALLEPWLVDVLGQRAAGLATPAAPVELLVLTLAFALALFAVIAAIGRIAFATHVPGSWQSAATQFLERTSKETQPRLIPAPAGPRQAEAETSRAYRIAGAVASLEHREATYRTASSPRLALAPAAQGTTNANTPLGQRFRRTRTRVSSSAERRDKQP